MNINIAYVASMFVTEGQQWAQRRSKAAVNSGAKFVIDGLVTVWGSVTLVLLPLKYEIDDSVTVTVVLLGEEGRCRLMGGR